MKVKIITNSELSKSKLATHGRQISDWHHSEWGKYHPTITPDEWFNDTLNFLTTGKTFFAFINNQLAGSVSIKMTNMENKFPNYAPWLSDLYVNALFRNKKISTVLIAKLIHAALIENYQKIYLFTHTLALENYYQNFGWNIISLEGEDKFYKDKPILLFCNETVNLYETILNYIDKNNISHNDTFNEFHIAEVIKTP